MKLFLIAKVTRVAGLGSALLEFFEQDPRFKITKEYGLNVVYLKTGEDRDPRLIITKNEISFVFPWDSKDTFLNGQVQTMLEEQLLELKKKRRVDLTKLSQLADDFYNYCDFKNERRS